MQEFIAPTTEAHRQTLEEIPKAAYTRVKTDFSPTTLNDLDDDDVKFIESTIIHPDPKIALKINWRYWGNSAFEIRTIPMIKRWIHAVTASYGPDCVKLTRTSATLDTKKFVVKPFIPTGDFIEQVVHDVCTAMFKLHSHGVFVNYKPFLKESDQHHPFLQFASRKGLLFGQGESYLAVSNLSNMMCLSTGFLHFGLCAYDLVRALYFGYPRPVVPRLLYAREYEVTNDRILKILTVGGIKPTDKNCYPAYLIVDAIIIAIYLPFHKDKLGSFKAMAKFLRQMRTEVLHANQPMNTGLKDMRYHAHYIADAICLGTEEDVDLYVSEEVKDVIFHMHTDIDRPFTRRQFADDRAGPSGEEEYKAYMDVVRVRAQHVTKCRRNKGVPSGVDEYTRVT